MTAADLEIFRYGELVVAEIKRQRTASLAHIVKFRTTIKVVGFDSEDKESPLLDVIETRFNQEDEDA